MRSNLKVPNEIRCLCFFYFPNFELVREVVCVICGPPFFGHPQATLFGPPQYKQRLFIHCRYFSCSVRGLNLFLSICMGSYLLLIKLVGVAWGVWNFFVLAITRKAFPTNVQKYGCRNNQFTQLFNSMLWDLTWLKVSPSCCYIAQIGINSWMQLHLMKCHMPIAWIHMDTQM